MLTLKHVNNKEGNGAKSEGPPLRAKPNPTLLPKDK